MENKTSSKEYCVFVFMRGNSFNGLKLNEDGTIIASIKQRRSLDDERDVDYISTNELTIEHKYGEESNSDAYNFLSELFDNGDVLRITSSIENGIFNKKIEKITDKEFCQNTFNSWNSIKHHWFHPESASKRIQEHLEELA